RPAAGWLPDSLLPGFNAADALLNLLVYMPFGFLWAGHQRRRGHAGLTPVLLLAAGTSLGLEALQHFLPGRTTSGLDSLLNITGAGLGALLATGTRTGLPGWLQRQRLRWLRDDAPAAAAALTVLLWLFIELSPLLPDLSPGGIRHSLLPLYNGLRNPALLDLQATLARLGLVLAFALALLQLLKPQQPRLRLLALLLPALLAARVLISGSQLSLDLVLGTLLGFGLVLLLRRREPLWPWVGAAAALCGYILAQGQVDAGAAQLHPFNWRPFSPQISHGFGLTDVAAQLWPFLALGLFLRQTPLARAGSLLLWSGMLAIAALSFGLEWQQRGLPGRQGDITDVILALLGWLLAWLLSAPQPAPRPLRPLAASQALYAFGILLAASLAATLLIRPQAGNAGQELQVREIPAPEGLPAAELPGFRMAHPRLPYPTPRQLDIIRAENPHYLEHLQRRASDANRRHHRVFDAVMAEVLVPGSQDLGQLHAELLELELRWRGNQQTKPLAMAYDWLYDKWSEAQRASLLEKTLDACEYQIRFIRRNQLSPYNVYLYNNPFQALMACAIAVHGDHPRAGAVMNFTHHYWKHSVLPVWRQVMGANGGWHEGAEYVAIGIGDAVFQLPNMWRAATGEDLFASEPGLRGFADFLVHRKRPDGEDIHIGDGGLYENSVPDAAALGVELNHPAAYSLDGCPNPKRPQPLSWPWGPLPDTGLCRPEARQQLPLSHYADGVGLLLARSDWSPEATFVTFKAGDNYWSHMHLDQGAFTIYKGGALAIDSGIYPQQYGSDHHMNYAYQSIAHNVITVTDPADTVPRHQSDRIRHIHNDGGQRRIGSGWGLAAPLDLEHWREQYDLYHTGETLAVYRDAGAAVKLADLTPAYTNRLSGKGTFAHRTRRVESLRRAFVYDRVQDAVIVFDRVEATRADFTKRWLLHSQTEPRVEGSEFLIELPPGQDRPGHAGGRLEGHILLPEQPRIQRIGGEGQEFRLGDRNYDDDGAVYTRIAKRDERGRTLEPGAWRLEVSPSAPARLDHYLVVMLPSLLDAGRATEARRLPDRDNAVGCEIRSGERRSQWWFARDGSQVELVRFDKEGEIERRIIR
ncbi:MAG: heparinase, partial [Gammaproteobacteria bacterium]|nr:heparinase [Gammaproteobacteria bacterium]